jgi:hypothetical protein
MRDSDAPNARVDPGSPQWLARVLSDWRTATVNKMAEVFEGSSDLWHLALIVLIGSLSFFLFAVYNRQISGSTLWTEGRFLIAFPAFTLPVALGVLLSRRLSDTSALVVLAVCQPISLVLCGYLFGVSVSEISVYAGFVSLFIILGIALYAVQRKMKWRSNTAFFIIFVIACCLTYLQFTAFNYGRDKQFSKIYSSFRWLLVMGLPIFAAGVYGGGKLDRQFRNYILFPLAFFYPLPTRMHFWERKINWQLASRGLLDVFTGLAFLGLIWAHRYVVTEFQAFKTNSGFFSNGIVAYFYTYFRSAAIITIPVGLARMAGYALPDPYDFPLLAPTPQERWRRWNTYFYDFFMVSTFHPIFKYTNSVLLGVFGVFWLTALTHNSATQMFGLTKEAKNFFDTDVVWFFFLHACFVYLGLKTQRFWPAMASRRGWIGVAVTTLLMSLIHFFKLM